jgi:hypothetical protein
MTKRPSKKFKPEKPERVEYKNVSYRLPKHLLEELNGFVDKEMSACSLVSQILTWALEDMRKAKK